LVKLALVMLVFLALALGGIQNFPRVLAGLMSLILSGVMISGGVAIVVGIIVLIVKQVRRQRSVYDQLRGAGETIPEATSPPRAQPPLPTPAATWTASRVRSALDQIDWFQFEKFCAALLRADGFDVERKGGAQPDGGVDLVVRKGEQSALIQCKHWRGWVVQERVVREMLGSMTHFGVKQGAIYTLKGWTKPAEQFAKAHAITLVNGDELAASAAFSAHPVTARQSSRRTFTTARSASRSWSGAPATSNPSGAARGIPAAAAN
jgi:hypothetical protein